MTTATATTLVRGRGASSAVLKSEIRLFLREPGSLFGVMVFPPVLLVILGSIPAFREADSGPAGLRLIDAYVPVTVLLPMIVAGLQAMAPVIAGYRERGILRRMSTTPVRPPALLGAQMTIHGVAALASSLVSLAIGRLAFDVRLPQQAIGYALALLLSIVVALSLGALVAARARTAKVASAIGSTVFFPSMFCAGVWLPVQSMPHTLASVVELTPFGAASQAMSEAATGGWPWSHLAVLVVWAVLLSGAAARWFRWE
ncbi:MULTISPECIES: ABC transporter permease [unclassified Streptomyces]|uniref:ABC transporter permease n=1 Tax=unclassified Streptomyces TaxID=2593676 RepID=UPI0036E7E24E